LRDRRRRASRRWHWSHDDKRVILHRHGRLDPERVWQANIMIGMPVWWTGLFGDPRALSYVVPRILRFPERRSEIAKLRAEIEEMRKTVSVRAEAV
jgi:hypothetical protein